MEDLIKFAFNNLLSRMDEFAVYVPLNEQDLAQSCLNLENIFQEYRELVHYIRMSISVNED